MPRRRRWPLILTVVVLVAAGLWSGLWYYAAGRAEAAIAGWREREAKADRIHSCGAQTVSGFPFRFELRCAEPAVELRSHQPPLALKGKDLVVAAQVWQPTLLTSVIAGPVTIAEPGQATSIVVNWRHAQTQVRGLPVAPERVSIAIDDAAVDRVTAGESQSLFKAARLELNGRMLEGSVRSNPVIELALKLAAASAPTLHAVTAIPLDADITAVLRGLKDFSPKPWPARFREMQAVGGRIEVTKARVQQGDTVAMLSGVLGLSANGRLDGQLRVTVAGLEKFVQTLGLDKMLAPPAAANQRGGALGALDRLSPGLGNIARQNAVPALIASLNFIGQPAELDGKRAIALPLRFNDGVVMLGPIPLGQTPALY